jgi:hypothetical protein
LEIKRENSKGENFMKSITLDYFFHYTVAWDHLVPFLTIYLFLSASLFKPTSPRAHGIK